MAGGYTKLFSDILTSSIWNEDTKTRILWITMLAMCDATGYIRSSKGSLPVMARLSRDEVDAGLAILEAPDEDSRSEAHEGRRLEKVEGGWIVLNYEAHRNRLSNDSEAVSNRERQRRHREKIKEKEEDSNGSSVTSRDTASASASASASADAFESVSKDGESEGKKPKRKKALSETDKRRIRVDELTPMMIRIGSWFGRRETTKWTTYEKEALDSIKPDITEVNTLEIYYDFDHPFDCDYRRRKLEQLLNNWASEIDKATKFISDKNREEEGDNNGW